MCNCTLTRFYLLLGRRQAMLACVRTWCSSAVCSHAPSIGCGAQHRRVWAGPVDAGGGEPGGPLLHGCVRPGARRRLRAALLLQVRGAGGRRRGMRCRVKPRVEVKVSRYYLEQRSYGRVAELEGDAGV